MRLYRSPSRPVIHGPGPTPNRFITSRPTATSVERTRAGESSWMAENTGPNHAVVDADATTQQT